MICWGSASLLSRMRSIVSAQRSVGWRELDRAGAALAGGYRRLGLERGDRLASLMPNRVDQNFLLDGPGGRFVLKIVHYLACFRAGLIATPLNYRYTAREVDRALG
jgi:long-chain acyl-CoA synthetase